MTNTRPPDRPNLRLVSSSDAPLPTDDAELATFEEAPTPPGTPEQVPATPARAWAEAAYFTFRSSPQCGTRSSTLDQMLSVLAHKRDRLPPDAPPADRMLLETWEREGGWETRYREQELIATLDDEGLKPDRRLSALLRTEQDAREVLERAIHTARQPGALKDDVVQYTQALNAWTTLQTKIAEAEAETRRRNETTNQRDHWGARRQELLNALMAEYRDLGPQYEVIVGQLVRQQLRMEQAEASGRDVPLAEYNDGTKLVIQLVGQLQKYTESTKSEAIRRDQQEAILAVLKEVESELSEYPQVWQRIARRIHQKISIAGELTERAGA